MASEPLRSLGEGWLPLLDTFRKAKISLPDLRPVEQLLVTV